MNKDAPSVLMLQQLLTQAKYMNVASDHVRLAQLDKLDGPRRLSMYNVLIRLLGGYHYILFDKRGSYKYAAGASPAAARAYRQTKNGFDAVKWSLEFPHGSLLPSVIRARAHEFATTIIGLDEARGMDLTGFSMGDPLPRWAVFCPECRKTWDVPTPHSGKEVCAECTAKLAVTYSYVLMPFNKDDASHIEGVVVTGIVCTHTPSLVQQMMADGYGSASKPPAGILRVAPLPNAWGRTG